MGDAVGLNTVADALGHQGRIFGRGLGQHQHKFFAAKACHPVNLLAQAALQNARHLGQHQITGLMAMDVVDPFEKINIAHQHRQWAVVALRACQLIAELLAQIAAVKAASERVGDRNALDLTWFKPG